MQILDLRNIGGFFQVNSVDVYVSATSHYALLLISVISASQLYFLANKTDAELASCSQ